MDIRDNGWKDRIVELSNEFGLSDTEISQLIYREFGIFVSNDTVRYHARRKFKKAIQKEMLVNNGISKILVLTDLHSPFHREKDIIDIILKHRHEIDTIIFGGDVTDCYDISKFPKLMRKPLGEEMIITYKFLKKIDILTPNIKKVLLWGNHEYRFVYYLGEHGGQLASLHSNNILEEIVHGFTHRNWENKHIVKYPTLSDNFVIVNNWFYQHGDVIVAHPKNFSKIAMRTGVMTTQYFVEQGFVGVNAVIVAHTHKQGTTTAFNKWVVESGCLCMPMEYSKTGNVNYTPQRYGYVLVTQKNGIIDINESRAYLLDLEEGEDEWVVEEESQK